MSESFEGRVIVLTGASEGIGRALALRLALERPRLALVARSRERLQTLAEECRQHGAETLVLPVDLTEERACRSIIEDTQAHYAGIDVLINNAGSTMWARVDELVDTSVFESMLRLNYLTAAWLCYYALPSLKASRGRIVAVASIAGLTGVPTRSAYAASKHAMIGFFESLRVELRGSGVAVTIVAPDFVRSEIHRRASGADGRPLGTSPMRESHIMTAEECAQRIVAAARRRERLVVTSLRGRAGRWLKLIAPGLLDLIAARAIRRGQ